MTPQEMREQDERDLKHLQLISQLLGGVRQVVNTTVERDPEYYKRGTMIKETLDRIEAYEATKPKFNEVYCSQCGGKFGPRDSGYSHCKDHQKKPSPPYPFCSHEEKCIAAHRCLSDPCCAD